MVEKPKHKNNRGMVILLVALVVVMMLIIGILAIINLGKNNGSNNGGNSASDNDDVVCDVGEDYYEISACIDGVYDDNGDINLIVNEYRSAIDRAKKAGNYELASELIAQRSAVLMGFSEYCDKNIELLNNEDLTGYENAELVYIYSVADSVALNCNNEEMESKWFKLMVEAQEGIEYEAF